MNKILLKEILFKALSCEYGLIVNTSSPSILKRKLNALRTELKKLGSEEFSTLRFKSSPINPESEIWIVKKEQKDG